MNNQEYDNVQPGQPVGDGDEVEATRPSSPIRDDILDDTIAMPNATDARNDLDETIAVAPAAPEAGQSTAEDSENRPTPIDDEIGAIPSGSDRVDDTAPHQVNVPPPGPPASEDIPTDGGKKPKRGRVVIFGILVVILLGVLGGLVGYRFAITDRQQNLQSQVALAAATQFQMGVQDLEAGRYEVARQRFEYVIRLDPQFPGAAEKLAEVMLKMAEQTTPTAAFTPTFEPTSTPDTRNEDEIFNQAQAFMRAGDWVNALITLDALRDTNLNYKTLQVDGMYYIALRYRGVDKILKEGNLEGGMYDLALTEKFGPLDKEADGYRTWARFYLTGASFWEVDWEKVVYYFSQVYPALPNLRDGSGWTTQERYRIALMNYGDKLFIAGDACGARDQYNLALTIGYDQVLVATATQAQLVCSPPTATPVPVTAEPTAAETTETEVTPEETPSETPVTPEP
ncbi:MAG: hypothetical protein HPY76_07070 [Anaerolineae bacterium]|jgi:tetratricopeptide (TPR) repeat protein|nr:hypothetical protein [Anaerolineae bacterium]